MRTQLISVVTLLFVASALAASPIKATVYNQNGQYSIKYGVEDISGYAWGSWIDEVDKDGWGKLYVHADSVNKKPEDVMYAAGYLEGVLTAVRIEQNWANLLTTSPSIMKNYALLTKFFLEHYSFVQSSIRAKATDPYWMNINHQFRQLEGLTAGYGTSNGTKMAVTDMLMLSSWYDLGDILRGLSASLTLDDLHMLTVNSHCSSIVRVSDDLSSLYSGHTTWAQYGSMLRILKSYDFKIPHARAQTISFSSYPGILSSTDDFFITNTGFCVMETTNEVPNNELFKSFISPKTLMSWTRVMAANRMAKDGKHWVEVYSKLNSGTYNNQWIVVDYNKFEPGKPLKEGLLWISEQIPGHIESADMTRMLSLGYWPSYNIPYFKKISEVSGWEPYAKNSTINAYETAPRANVFRRDNYKVSSLKGIKDLLRYNDFEHDPLAMGNPSYQLCSRFDLMPEGKGKHVCFGGTDTKVTDNTIIKNMIFEAQSGPTHNQQPVFSWSGTPVCDKIGHAGMPDAFNFDWVKFTAFDY
eukprot:TRINITY_DN358_c0_g1_i1.p1 TRINITY_DN358_c0_g1~~TRINITY_DN358_c0_g1_i1.p1  ORF type:complete len:527 (-),score=126.30 TRINITY_DN358_c0_g1_i1:97-1677(-)